MVMQYGMSRLGRVNFREGNRSAFLATGGGESYGRDYSEQTAREIDQEVKRLIDESAGHAKAVLTERRAALEALAKRLMEVEVVDGEDLKSIVDATIDGPRVVPGTVPLAPSIVSGTSAHNPSTPGSEVVLKQTSSGQTSSGQPSSGTGTHGQNSLDFEQ
jgi:cell division protease FtsH